MIYCFDTYYKDDSANTAVIGIKNWSSSVPDIEINHISNEVNEYESGAFYKRELPCILATLEKIDLNPEEDILLIDGFVQLSDSGKLGLGGYLYQALDEKLPVIGVAKSDFISLQNLKRAVYRGVSKKPLYVTTLGIDLEEASQCILEMHGENRMPTILKLVDYNSRVIED